MSSKFIAMPREARVGEVLKGIRASKCEHEMISYIYVVAPEDRLLIGVVDLRDLVLAEDDKTLGELMVSPAVSAEENDVTEDLENIFGKYHYRMIPVVDPHDHLLGVVHYGDVMKSS
jgi:magnesium transporter